LLSYLIASAADDFSNEEERASLQRSLGTFIAMVEACGLPHPETVTLLRSDFCKHPQSLVPETGFHPSKMPDFELGPGKATPFQGLSLIDSLFCDWFSELMALYMEKVLASSLPDAVKRDALRLAYPDRSNILRMCEALQVYGRQIRDSALPAEMKLDLTQPLRTYFEPVCALL
jgi:hypothetical protein